jgi:hypothetical protein
MGVLRGMGKWAGSFLFATFLVVAVMSVGIVSFTGYDNMKALFGGMFNQMTSGVDQSTIDALTASLKVQCQGKESVEFTLDDGQTLSVPCDKVNEEGAQADEIMTTAAFDSMYYKDYQCNLIECISSGQMTVLLSAKTNQFFMTVEILAFAATGLGAVLIIVCEETWPNRMKSIGLKMVMTGVSFFVLQYLAPVLLQMISPEMATIGEAGLNSALETFFAPIVIYFACILIAGAALAVAGFAWQHLNRKNEKAAGKKGVQPM